MWCAHKKQAWEERETHATSRRKTESYLQIELCVLLLWMKLLLRRVTPDDMTDKSIIVYWFSISTCMTWSTNHPKLTNHLTYFQSWQPHPQLPAGAEHLPPPLTHHQTQLHQNHHMTEVRSTPSTFDWSCNCCSKVAFPNHPCQNSLPSQEPSRGPKHTPVSKVTSCWTMKLVFCDVSRANQNLHVRPKPIQFHVRED